MYSINIYQILEGFDFKSERFLNISSCLVTYFFVLIQGLKRDGLKMAPFFLISSKLPTENISASLTPHLPCNNYILIFLIFLKVSQGEGNSSAGHRRCHRDARGVSRANEYSYQGAW